MSSSRRMTSSQRRGLVAVSTLLLLQLAVAPVPSGQFQLLRWTHVGPSHCPLTRVNDQLVRCDDLTGGVRAPLWMQQR